MKITVLGSGSAYGSPRAGNYAGDCDLSNEKNIRLRSSFYLKDGKDELLVECGPDFRQQMNKYGTCDFENIFLSHGHADHMGGVWELTNWVNVWDKNINLYGDIITINEVKARFPFMFGDYFERNSGGISLNVIEEGKVFIPKNSSMELLPMKYIHAGGHSFGFRYKNFVFTPDLEYVPNSTAKYVENADLWIVECDSVVVDPRNSHNNVMQSLEWAKKYRPKRMILNHLDVTVDYEKVSKMLPDGIELAFDGMVIEL
jgi:phosphoribosyl 1,2-cyclic phosphate phosphodiesterase